MKKNILFAFLGAVFLLSSLFISCGEKTPVANEYGFFEDVNVAMKDAQKNNRPMIIMITAEGDDELSEAFLQVARSEDFKNKITTAFTIVHMDFSSNTYKSTVVTESVSKAEREKIEAKAILLQENLQFTRLLNAQTTPSFFMMTKDEYYICELQGNAYGESYIPSSADQFLELILNSQDKITQITNLAEKTKTGTKLERIQAIDELFESTEYNLRVFLADLVETVIKLDKNNESGLLGKYLYADAENTALDCFTSSDLKGAVNAYLSVADNPLISPEYKQQAFFMASYFLTVAGSDDTSSIIQYLHYALDADPEGELTDTINGLLNYFAQIGE